MIHQANDKPWWAAAAAALRTGQRFQPGSPFLRASGLQIFIGHVTVHSITTHSITTEIGDRIRLRATLRHHYVMPQPYSLPTEEVDEIQIVGEWDRSLGLPTPEFGCVVEMPP